MTDQIRSARGYYYKLDESPYVYKSPYGDSFHLPSIKKLEMMEKYTRADLDRLDKTIARMDMSQEIEPELLDLLRKAMIRSTYRRIISRG